MSCPSVEPIAEPIWMIGPSRPTAAPLPIATAEASDLMTATTGRMRAAVVIDRVHHLGHAVAAGLGGEVADEKGDDDRADHRHQDDERSPGLGGVNTLAS